MAEIGRNIVNDMARQERFGAKIPKEVSREGITESIEITAQEMVTIATLKEALANYFLLDDIYEYEENTDGLAYLMGRLELSLIRRKQSLGEDRKALLEL